MIAPGFESHQCLAGMWKRWLDCNAGCQEVSRCHTRGESQRMCNIRTCTPLLSLNKAEPTLALKPRGDITRSPKRGISGPTKRTHVLQFFFKKTKTKTKTNGNMGFTFNDIFLKVQVSRSRSRQLASRS